MNKENPIMEAFNGIPVKYDLRPTYFDDFQCLAGDCRLTCCKGWHITFDKKDFMSMKRLTGSPEFNDRMRDRKSTRLNSSHP